MKIALAQMHMTEKISENLARSLRFCDEAADSDLLFFPEIQLTPFFPQYEKRSAPPPRVVSCHTEAGILSVSAMLTAHRTSARPAHPQRCGCRAIPRPALRRGGRPRICAGVRRPPGTAW